MNANTDHIILGKEQAASFADLLLPASFADPRRMIDDIEPTVPVNVPRGKTVKYDGEGQVMIVDDPDYMTEDGMFRKHRKKITDKRPKVKRKKNKKIHRK
jgi:hypothetical protein